MEGLVTQGYTADDAPAVAQLFNRLAEHAGVRPWAAPEQLRVSLASWLRDPEFDSRLVFAPDRTLAAVALVSTPPPGGTHPGLGGGVHPAWRGRGLGRRLLRWQLDRAAEIHQAVAPGARWEAHSDADLTGDGENGDGVRLFRRFGLTPARYWFTMAAPTAAPPDTPVPDGLRLERFAPQWERETYAVHMEAFADHWGFQQRPFPAWRQVTVGSERFRPEWSMLAWDRDRIAGYLLTYQDVDPGQVYIGQVGVRAGWRRRGVASALLVRVLAAAGRAGRRSAWLRVDADSPTGAVGVYERAGFTVESRAVTYTLPLPGADQGPATEIR